MTDKANPRSSEAPRVNLDKRGAETPASLAPPPLPPAAVGRPVSRPMASRWGPKPLLLGGAAIGLLVVAFAGWLLIGAGEGSRDRPAIAGPGPSALGATGEAGDNADSAGSDPSSPGVLDVFPGSWNGVVSQFDDGPQVDFPMTLTLVGGDGELTGTTTYDLVDGKCSGRLAFVSGDATVVEFRERISNGHCVGAGDVSVRSLTTDSVSFEYRATKRSGATQVVRGVLTRY